MKPNGTQHPPARPGARILRAASGLVDDDVGTIVSFGLVVVWVVVLAGLARHELVVSLDTMSNYAHVWWIADRLWNGSGIPWTMDVLGAGEALTYPYAAVPWTTAALAWPLLDEHAVSVWLALGGVMAVAATFYAAPELRRGWWAAAALVNPALVMAPIAGQLPFLWAVSALLVGIGRWRRGHTVSAVVLVALAQVNHAAVLGPVTAVIAAAWWYWEPHRRRLVVAWIVATVPALPAAYLVIASPVFVESSFRDKIVNFFGTVGMRGLVVAVPLCLLALQGRIVRVGARAALSFAWFVVLNIACLGPLNTDSAWAALRLEPETTTAQWVDTSGFTPGVTYRYLRADDQKVGMYRTLRAGGRLDSEFFPESIVRRSWPDPERYSEFLTGRGVDRVVVFDSYQRRFGTNEQALLEAMAVRPCRPGEVDVSVLERAPTFTVYAIDRACASG
jgi:hypothetical protein